MPESYAPFVSAVPAVIYLKTSEGLVIFTETFLGLWCIYSQINFYSNIVYPLCVMHSFKLIWKILLPSFPEFLSLVRNEPLS